MADTSKELARVTPSLFRRLLAVLAMAGAGTTLVWLGLGGSATGFAWKLATVFAGAGLIVMAERMWRATAQSIVLTREALTESSGRLLCRVSEIEKVDRGAFAFKPSNGMLVRLSAPGTTVWAPGLWWRYGRRIGIGGVTPAGQAKFMADMIALMLADTDED